MGVDIGAGVGEKLLSFVAGAKRRLVIVSPWLSPACADLAVKKQEEGVDVTVVTSRSPDNKTHQEALSHLVRKKMQKTTQRQRLALCVGVVLVLGGILYAFGTSFSVAGLVPSLISVVAGAVLCAMSRSKTHLCSTVGTLLVYMPSEPLLHAKLYVADDGVAVSSANFTVSGMRYNLECVTFLQGHDIAEGVTRQVGELVSDKALVLKREDG